MASAKSTTGLSHGSVETQTVWVMIVILLGAFGFALFCLWRRIGG